MKVLAIIDLKPSVDPDTVREQLPREIQGSWELFTAGVLREAYATSAPSRVIFVLEADSASAADAHLQGLPLVAGGLLHVELIELRPFANWSAPVHALSGHHLARVARAVC